MELNELKQTINEYNKLIKQDSAEFPPESRAGWTLKQQLAKNDLPKLQKDYFTELTKTLHKVNVVGGNPDMNMDFAKRLAEKVPTLVVQDVYGDLATQVLPLLTNGKDLGPTAWQRFLERAGDYSDYYQTFPYAVPAMPLSLTAGSLSELRIILKGVVEKYWGDTLNKAYVYQQVFKWSLTQTNDFTYGFVVVYQDSEQDKDRNTMFTEKPSFTVSFDENDKSTEEVVTKLIEKAKKHFKKGNKNE